MGIPLYRWLVYVMDNPTKVDDWVQLYEETSIFNHI